MVTLSELCVQSIVRRTSINSNNNNQIGERGEKEEHQLMIFYPGSAVLANQSNPDILTSLVFFLIFRTT